MERLKPLREETPDRGVTPVAVRRCEVIAEYRAKTREGRNSHNISENEATPDRSKLSPQGLSPSESTDSPLPTSSARKFAYVCRDWERGSCHRQNCKFAHGPVPVASGSLKTWSQIARRSSQTQKEAGTQTTWNIDASIQVGASYVEQTHGNNQCRSSSPKIDTDRSSSQDTCCTTLSLSTSPEHSPATFRREQPASSWLCSLTNAIARITRKKRHPSEMEIGCTSPNLKDDTSLSRVLDKQLDENESSPSPHCNQDQDKQRTNRSGPQATVVKASRTPTQVTDGSDVPKMAAAIGEHRPTRKQRQTRTLDKAPGHTHAPAPGGEPTQKASPELITRSPKTHVAPLQSKPDVDTSVDANDDVAQSKHIGPESLAADNNGLNFAIWRHDLKVDAAVVERLMLLDPLELTSIAENKLLLEAKIAEVREILAAQGVAETTDLEQSDVALSLTEVDAEQVETYRDLCKQLERTKPKKRSVRQTLLQLVLDNAPAKARQVITNRGATVGQSRDHEMLILSAFASNMAMVHFHCLDTPLPEEWRW